MSEEPSYKSLIKPQMMELAKYAYPEHDPQIFIKVSMTQVIRRASKDLIENFLDKFGVFHVQTKEMRTTEEKIRS